MGKGLIVSGGTDGLYQLELTLDRTRKDQREAELAVEISILTTERNEAQVALDAQEATLGQAIDKQNAAITAYNAGTVPFSAITEASKAVATAAIPYQEALYVRDTLQLRLAAAEREQFALIFRYPQDPTVSAWCVDHVEDLTGVVRTIEIPGEVAGVPVVIGPGFADGATYVPETDGQLQPSRGSEFAAVYWNWAMLPGWQKWLPTHRLGAITSIDPGANTCNVLLDAALSSQQSLDVNQSTTLTGIPINYMDCDAEAFDVSDRVVVEFTGQDWANPQVIGFESNPQPCTWVPGIKCSPESDTSVLSRQTFTWDGANWSTVSNGGATGRATWRDSAGSVVLSWQGPENGLWLTGGNVLQYGSLNDWEDIIWSNFGNAIWSEGRIVALARGGVSSVCIQDRGADLRLWVILNAEPSVQLEYADLPKPFVWPTTPIQGDYNAMTNPTGWNLSQIWLQGTADGETAAQIWQCNSSGTGAVCMRIRRTEDALTTPVRSQVRLANLAPRARQDMTFDPPNLVTQNFQTVTPTITPWDTQTGGVTNTLFVRCTQPGTGDYRDHTKTCRNITHTCGTRGFFSAPDYQTDIYRYQGQMVVGVTFDANTLVEIECDFDMSNWYVNEWTNSCRFGFEDYLSDGTPVTQGVFVYGWIDMLVDYGDCNLQWTDFPTMHLVETRYLERRATWRIKGGQDLWSWTGDEERTREYDGVRWQGAPFLPEPWANPLADPRIPDPNPYQVVSDVNDYVTAATMLHYLEPVALTWCASRVDQTGIDPFGSTRNARIVANGSDEYSLDTNDTSRDEVNFFGLPVQTDTSAHITVSGVRNRQDKPMVNVEFNYDPAAPYAYYLEDGDPVALTGLTGANPRFGDVRLV